MNPKKARNRSSVRPNRSSKRNAQRPLADDLIQSYPPIFDAFHLDEPKLVFGGGFTSVDPKMGIETYGPYGIDASASRTVRVGLVGTGEGIQRFISFLQRGRGPITAGFNKRNKPLDPLTFPDFPGCSEAHTFRCTLQAESSAHHRTIHAELFSRAVVGRPAQEKVAAVVQLLMPQLEALAELDPRPDVVVLLLPAVVERECATLGGAFAGRKMQLTLGEKWERKLQRETTRTGQTFLPFAFDSEEGGEQKENRAFFNIHHAIKAHAMGTGLTTQIVWESTLDDPHLSSVAWNLFAALYYKAGHHPWRLQSMPDRTCFVGVSFFKETPHADAEMQTSLAQVFGAGDGLVLKGEKAIYDKRRDRKAHLDEQGAEKLLQQAIALYERHHNGPPNRVVVHKTSRFWPEELRGFRRGLGSIYHFDFLALETLGTRFLRIGKKPPLRGTVIQLAARNYLLYGNGYVPYLRCYPGKRLPRPLEIVEHHGDSPAITVCREILALTKLNWNSCAFGSSEPITIRFAKSVGRILAELPKGAVPQTRYQYYM
ncbi:MAG: hypothetical protein QOD99_2556 [Chthoniobacter sp.]|nr:hypothetical protein [Chthoniobacter sp.]